MAATFFISYAHLSRRPNGYFDEFARNLDELLQDRTGRHIDDLVFIDREVEAGTDWTHEVREALRACRVFISVESPAYFLESKYCVKEWNVFRKRLDEYARATQKPAPPLHIRVPWQPIRDSHLKKITPEVQNIQDTREILGRYAKDGLEHLLRRNLTDVYEEVLAKLADLAISALENYPLPPANEIPHLSEVDSTFWSSEQVGVDKHASASVAGLEQVYFGVVAGSREEVSSLRAHTDSYGNGAIDWKPFYPTVPLGIGPLAQGVAASHNLPSGYLKMEDDLTTQLIEAEKARKVVILLVDPWALEMGLYREHVRPYNDGHYLNCFLLIPWPSDSQTRDWRAKLSTRIQATLFKTAKREPRSYREAIRSRERLESVLIEAITRAKNNIFEYAEVTRSVDDSNSTVHMLPRIPGPGGA